MSTMVLSQIFKFWNCWYFIAHKSHLFQNLFDFTIAGVIALWPYNQITGLKGFQTN